LMTTLILLLAPYHHRRMPDPVHVVNKPSRDAVTTEHSMGIEPATIIR
jgi:hypothetical protein